MKRLALFLLFPAMLLAQSSNPAKPGGVNGDVQCKSGSKFVACTTGSGTAAFSSLVVGNGLPADATVVANKEAQWDSTNHVLTLCSTAPCDTILRAIANTADGTGTGGCGGGGTNGAGKQCVWRAGGNGVTVTLTAGTNTEGGMVGANAAGTVDYLGSYATAAALSSQALVGQLINTPGGSGGTATVLLFPWTKTGLVTAMSGAATTAVSAGANLNAAAGTGTCVDGNSQLTTTGCAGATTLTTAYQVLPLSGTGAPTNTFSGVNFTASNDIDGVTFTQSVSATYGHMGVIQNTQSSNAGTKCDFGIYSLSGSTFSKVVANGGYDCNATANGYVGGVASATLNANTVYAVVMCTSNAGATAPKLDGINVSADQGAMLNNNSQKRAFKVLAAATNHCTAGVLPASFTLTDMSALNTAPAPLIFMEP